MEALDKLRREAGTCPRCPLYEPATQTVFGAGPASAWLMLVGEQPGDREDRAGGRFIGPAGVLDTTLDRAGIACDEVYVTNAVKHFRFERDGKRRLHKPPTVAHLRACRLRLDGELAAVRPAVVGTSARPRRRHCSARRSGSPPNAGASSIGRGSNWCRPCTRRRCCGARPSRGMMPWARSSPTWRWWRTCAAERTGRPEPRRPPGP